jgi:hypothetical protein
MVLLMYPPEGEYIGYNSTDNWSSIQCPASRQNQNFTIRLKLGKYHLIRVMQHVTRQKDFLR